MPHRIAELLLWPDLDMAIGPTFLCSLPQTIGDRSSRATFMHSHSDVAQEMRAASNKSDDL